MPDFEAKMHRTQFQSTLWELITPQTGLKRDVEIGQKLLPVVYHMLGSRQCRIAKKGGE